MTIDFQTDAQARLAFAQHFRSNRIYSLPVSDEMRADLSAVAIEEISIPTRVGPSRVICVTPPGARAARGSQPLYVNFHGGGFIGGHRERDTAFCAQMALETGARVFDVDYRLAPEHPFPAALHESHDVVAWAVAHSAELEIDPQRVVVGGQSAGGNLAAVICIMSRESRAFAAAGQLLNYPLLDGVTPPANKADPRSALTEEMLHAINVLYAGTPENLANPLLSAVLTPPEALVGLPPALILVAGRDPLRHEARRYAGLLIDAGVDVELRQFEDEDHGLLGEGSSRTATPRKVAFDWVNRILAQ